MIDARGNARKYSRREYTRYFKRGYAWYWEHLDAHLLRMFMRLNNTSYHLPDHSEFALTAAGFDYYDKRSFELDDGTEGFRAGHLHWMGVDSPLLISKVGVGSLGFFDTGWFKQADLEAWAGKEAEFSYWFFLTNGIGFAIQPPYSPLGLEVRVLQSRTIKGDVDFADGSDGDFVALWESAKAHAHIDPFFGIRIGVVASAFRQRLSADAATRKKFSQNKNGHRITGYMSLYFE